MKNYDVVLVSEKGNLQATTTTEDDIPVSVALWAVLSLDQVKQCVNILDIDNADTLLITRQTRLQLPPGITVVFHDGVNVNGPIVPSKMKLPPGVGAALAGRQLTSNTRVLVTYKVDVDEGHEDDDDDFEDDDDTSG